MLSAAILVPTAGIDPFVSTNRCTTPGIVGSAVGSAQGGRRGRSRVVRPLRSRFAVALFGIVSAAAALSGVGSFPGEAP